MFDTHQTLLLLVDLQTKLFNAMPDKEALTKNLSMLIKGAGLLNIPIIATEQYPAGLGNTIPELADLIKAQPLQNGQVNAIDKLSFSCWGEQRFRLALDNAGRRQILLAGIETHVCVYQTAIDLMDAGYRVQVAADAVSSRTTRNRDIGLQKMHDAGAATTSIEIALFELLKTAQAPVFKEISKLVK